MAITAALLVLCFWAWILYDTNKELVRMKKEPEERDITEGFWDE